MKPEANRKRLQSNRKRNDTKQSPKWNESTGDEHGTKAKTKRQRTEREMTLKTKRRRNKTTAARKAKTNRIGPKTNETETNSCRNQIENEAKPKRTDNEATNNNENAKKTKTKRNWIRFGNESDRIANEAKRKLNEFEIESNWDRHETQTAKTRKRRESEPTGYWKTLGVRRLSGLMDGRKDAGGF